MSKLGGQGQSRRRLLQRLGATALVGSGAGVPLPVHALDSGGRGSRRPNILVVLFDDLGFADLDCYGGEIGTPNLDRLARGGLQYTNFHTTGICSATRASLLTGLNPHSAGMGWLADTDAGTPGYRGDLHRSAVTLAEHLGAQGWSTSHVGKWHLNAARNDTNAGDPENWPLQRGFERAYWFHGHSSDYFRPAEFREGNATLEIEPRPDYYITDDLTDRAIADLQRHRARTPDAPFFMYLAHAAPHSPLQARAEDMAAVRGRYDEGWDAFRLRRFARQKTLGVMPEDARLPARDENVPAWSSLTAGQKRLHARYMEVYAGVVRRLDWNMGRLIQALEALGQLENTLLLLMSDNGGSPDAGPQGTPNLLAGLSGGITPAQAEAMIDEIGGPDSCPVYPLGWAMASCTPFRMYKHHTFGGGVADPLIVHWPAGVGAQVGLRRQYVHVSDVLPTILDAAGVAPVRTRCGRPAKPIEGLNFAPTLTQPDHPSIRREQYFELEGKRAYHTEDWEIVSSRRYGRPIEADRWELFSVRDDISQSRDLSAQHPEVVAELERRWWRAAAAHDVLPLDLRTTIERYFADIMVGGGQSRWTLVPPQERLLAHGAPQLLGRSNSVRVHLAGDGAGEGVLFAYGNMFLGVALYVLNGRLIYEASARPHGYRIESALPADAREIGVVQTMTQRPFAGSVTMSVDGREVAATGQRRLIFGRPYQGLEIGRNGAAPVSRNYAGPLPYEGRIERVDVSVDMSPYSAAERAALQPMFAGRPGR